MTQGQRNAAIRRRLQTYTEAHTRTKKMATKALVREGFVLSNGQPAPAYADAD